MSAVFKAITLTNDTPTFAWSAVAGQTYQSQYSTDLTQNNWNFFRAPAHRCDQWHHDLNRYRCRRPSRNGFTASCFFRKPAVHKCDLWHDLPQ